MPWITPSCSVLRSYFFPLAGRRPNELGVGVGQPVSVVIPRPVTRGDAVRPLLFMGGDPAHKYLPDALGLQRVPIPGPEVGERRERERERERENVAGIRLPQVPVLKQDTRSGRKAGPSAPPCVLVFCFCCYRHYHSSSGSDHAVVAQSRTNEQSLLLLLLSLLLLLLMLYCLYFIDKKPVFASFLLGGP